MITCNSCGKQLSDGAKFCKFCGAQQNVVMHKAVPVTKQRTMPEFLEGPENSSGKKSKKSAKKIILVIVAVLLVLAIVAACLLIRKLSETDEEKLRKILEESTTKPIIDMVCEDFDSDGEYEAYAILSDEGEEGDKEYVDADIYFVNEKKVQKIKENVTGESNGIITTDERTYVSFEEEVSEDESYSLIYTADGEDPAESEISGMYSDVHQEGSKIIVTDETGKEIEIDMPDGIKDIDSDKKNKKPEKPTKPHVEEEPEEIPVVDNYETNIETYKAYFSSSEWTDLLNEYYLEDNGYMEVSSCVIDLNDDKTYELMVSVMNKESLGVRGYQTQYFLFAIQNDSVVLLKDVAYWGGSGGGDSMSIKYDTVENKPVAIYESFARDGAWANLLREDFYSYDGTSLSVIMVTESEYLAPGTYYDEEIEKIKSETDLYVDYGDGDISYYKIDGDYVSEEDYELLSERYIADDPQCQMQTGTYYNPISYLN